MALKILCIGLVMVTAVGLVGFYLQGKAAEAADTSDTIYVLIPDSVNATEPAVQLWIDAGDELGFHLAPLHDSEFVSPRAEVHCAGIIVPDQLHRAANDAVIGALNRYVQNGGKLMLVYDAGTWDLNNRYVRVESRLSVLAGVRYALYDKYRGNSIEWAPVEASAASMEELEIPPGSFIPTARREDKISWRPVSTKDRTKAAEYTFSRYQYGDLKYPSFRTEGDFDGKVLLTSQAGLVAGIHRVGGGRVLFVNLPLGYLKNRTDGLLLHAFVQFFAAHLLNLPYLTPVPDGVGGLVLNWHVDARFALAPLADLERIGVFNQGPFSVHFTAGPDVDKFHDGKGLDVLHDAAAQRWIKYFLSRGYTVGSHGGWMHNYFGENINDNNEAEFEPYLDKNKDALEKVDGVPVREYSAPVGNQPRWVTHWLEAHGFLAYYFVGDAGMAPTRVYLDGERDKSIWAFPLLHMGRQAAFEEMQFDDIPVQTAKDWLLEVTDFVSQGHTARLVYSHPLGASRYAAALQAWMMRTAQLSHEGRFRWYTMTELANFLNEREKVRWEMETDSGGRILLKAEQPQSLAHFTWALPQSRYASVEVVNGSASVNKEDGYWYVTGGSGTQLTLQLRPVSPISRALEVAP